MILVHNARKPIPTGFTPIYVGRRTSYRPALGEDFSVLGNPYAVGKGWSREAAIEAYGADLAEAMSGPTDAGEAVWVLAERVRAGEKLALICWCSPLACHADQVKRWVEWAASPDRWPGSDRERTWGK